MKYSIAFVSVVFIIFNAPHNLLAQEASKVPNAKISDLAWIAGSWSSENGGTVTEEQWLEPRVGMMVGVNRMAFPNGKGTFEFLRIAETEQGLTYFASPTGKPATAFLIRSLEQHKVIFENMANDFPQRIIYERVDETLAASIEGDLNGKTKSMKWTWKRSIASK